MYNHSPNPTTDAALPALSPREKTLLFCLARNGFDLPTLSRDPNFTADDLDRFATSPALRAHLDSLLAISRLTLSLRAASARVSSINELEHVARHTTDLIQKRLAANNLLRATAAPLISSHDTPREQSRTRHSPTPTEAAPHHSQRPANPPSQNGTHAAPQPAPSGPEHLSRSPAAPTSPAPAVPTNPTDTATPTSAPTSEVQEPSQPPAAPPSPPPRGTPTHHNQPSRHEPRATPHRAPTAAQILHRSGAPP